MSIKELTKTFDYGNEVPITVVHNLPETAVRYKVRQRADAFSTIVIKHINGDITRHALEYDRETQQFSVSNILFGTNKAAEIAV